ncbi:MAG: hypothetical protein HYR66_04840 [Sphingobacteriales bacterium]|nr:hypothetical protein [Sphingobacteriales bacterium]MBI3718637.1 hypothetical protein [Sphingobacteriales bacterium]
METLLNGNGHKIDLMPGHSLLSQYSENTLLSRLTVQQALTKWYRFLKDGAFRKESGECLFDNLEYKGMLKSLQNDLELIPELLMDVLINNIRITDKKQYIRLVQALLINLSDILPEREVQEPLCNEVEMVLHFMQNFLYQHFDFDFRISVYCWKQLQESTTLKLEYWKIKLAQSPIMDVLQECLNQNSVASENYLSFRKVNYLKNMFRKIESSTSVINEAFIRELFIDNNLNTTGFIDYEINLIKTKISSKSSNDENLVLLKIEQFQIAQWKERPGVGYDLNHPAIKVQLNDWIIERIRSEELSILKGKNKDLQIDPESKVQTSVSVAKLAVLIRLLVADKIIINKTVAPMLRTVSKLFTTLQKDEISYGSLETKYHAPDKTTLNIMKEMLQKWAGIAGKL